MNPIERDMLDTLKRGRDEFGVVAVKAEFEAEGTRPGEFLRLLELARRADLKVALKIGGCEAVSDLLASQVYGVDYIIAPMVETPYALSKFADAVRKTHDADSSTEFLFNLETQTTLDNLAAMVPMVRDQITGIVFGRVDYTLSRGMPRAAIDEQVITNAVLMVARVCAARDCELVVGGSVSPASIPALRAFRDIRLDRFETRKIVFDGAACESDRIADGIANAVDFELLWLKNKRDHYAGIAREDQARIEMMEKRSAAASSPVRAAA